jgi:Immunity protein Imm1
MSDSSSNSREVWVEATDGQLLCALINGDLGTLIYLRKSGDAGFTSRNPDYAGPTDEKVKYKLENGQADYYPRSWAYPIEVVEKALEFFRVEQSPPPFINWHNDSGDGKSIARAAPRHVDRSARSR